MTYFRVDIYFVLVYFLFILPNKMMCLKKDTYTQNDRKLFKRFNHFLGLESIRKSYEILFTER